VVPTFEDADFQIINQSDNTKRLFFDLSVMNTSTDATLRIPPLAAVTKTVAFVDQAQAWTNTQTYNGAISIGRDSGGILQSDGDMTATDGDVLVVSDGGLGGQINLRGPASLAGIANANIQRFQDPSGRIVLAGADLNLTSQSAAIGSTALTTAQAGYYLVHYTLTDTTTQVGAATVQFGISYTDDGGATTQSGAALSLTAIGRDRGVFQVYLVSGAINYSVAVIGVIGAARYALRVRVEALG